MLLFPPKELKKLAALLKPDHTLRLAIILVRTLPHPNNACANTNCETRPQTLTHNTTKAPLLFQTVMQNLNTRTTGNRRGTGQRSSRTNLTVDNNRLANALLRHSAFQFGANRHRKHTEITSIPRYRLFLACKPIQNPYRGSNFRSCRPKPTELTLSSMAIRGQHNPRHTRWRHV